MNSSKDRICPHCNQKFANISGRSFSNHVRWCKCNPKRNELDVQTSNKIRESRQKYNDRILGELKSYTVTCHVCGKQFEVKERENKFPSKHKYYCSRSCANNHYFEYNQSQKEEIVSKIRKSVLHTRQTKMQNENFQHHQTLGNFKYNEGWHTTWDNQMVYLRSKLEKEYANKLDGLKIHYQVEPLRIVYHDTILNKMRYCIPDFLIDDTIIEIKSGFTYNKPNMIDKAIEYLKNYKFILVLDGVEYNINKIEDLPEQKQNFLIYDLVEQHKQYKDTSSATC